MKIAIPANGKVISDHFGHCTSFKIFETDNKKVLKQSVIENPGNHKPGVLPQLLKENRINVVIAGGIGQRAIGIFNELGIQVITGASGLIADVINRFLNGTLQGGSNFCDH